VRKGAKTKPRRRGKKSADFGSLPWKPEDLPLVAVPYWPRLTNWPSDSEIRDFVARTEGIADVRLAVMTGLRRWAEPASSQLLGSLGSLIVAVAAVGVGISSLGTLLYIGILIGVAVYLILAVIVFQRATNMDDRRKTAHAWIEAIEDELAVQNRSAISRDGRPSWLRRLL